MRRRIVVLAWVVLLLSAAGVVSSYRGAYMWACQLGRPLPALKVLVVRGAFVAEGSTSMWGYSSRSKWTPRPDLDNPWSWFPWPHIRLSRSEISCRMPFWMLAIISGAAILIINKPARQPASRTCPCGYSMAGLHQSICPECGRDPASPASPPKSLRRSRRAWVIRATAAAMLVPSAMFLRSKGLYGVVAACSGHNPFKLVPPTLEGERASQARGDAIVTAIKQFHAETGSYPEKLDDLVPRYIRAMELPVVGRPEWIYARDAKDGFILRYFVGPMNQSDFYVGLDNRWYLDR